MRWMMLMTATAFLGACAGPIGSQPTPIDAVQPTAAPTQEARPSTVAPIDTAQPAATPTIEFARYRSELPDLGEAPELNNKVWLNTDRPLRLVDLRGKVVVLDMWTFG